MEKYKKKSLNFMGFSRDLRKIERDNKRCLSRHQRFSIIRPLDDESITEEKKENNCRIPTIGKPKAGAGSRVELLQKWKQEKMVKKQQESKLKKPAFKVGATKPSPSPSVGNKPLFALDTSSRLFKSSFQVPNSRLFGKKQESLITPIIKISEVSNSQSTAKKTGVAAVNTKTSAKDMKIQPLKSKIVVTSKPESKWTQNKVIESRLQPLNVRSKVIPMARGAKSNIPSSGLPKPTTSRTLNKVSDQIVIPKSNVSKKPEGNSYNKIATLKSNVSKKPEGNSYDKHIPGKNNVKSIPKFSKAVASRQKGNISEKTSTSESKVLNKADNGFKLTTFECDLSHIEPVKEERKSFAPKGFMFQPPAELNSSLFLEDGPSAIFLKMRNRFLRTSTPKQNPSDEKSSPKINDIEGLKNEDAECLKNEDTECLKNEKSQCSKNTDKDLEPANKYDLETLLSSSFGSVSLNDVKPFDCKQSLKFELPEVTQNQEEMLLSSKIIRPEHSLTTEPLLTGAINSPILPDLVEIDKIEINSDIQPVGAINPAILPGSVEIDKTEMNFTDISPTGAINSLILSDLVEIDKTEKKSIGICATGGINPSILPDSVEIGKTEMNFTDTCSVDDSVFYEFKEIPDENTEKNQFLLNGFLQKQEKGPIKTPVKIRNFRRSEKPALTIINESLENTPKSALKNKILESVYTPRRSLRLAKLSGNFSSLDNLLDSPKPKNQDKTDPKGEFTPRRSLRLSKFSTEFNSAENLFDVRRPTLYGSPEAEKTVPKLHSKVTYDFDRLSSEIEEETCPRTTRSGKVSLLYTPRNKSRPSIMRHSIKGDLMSFSPNE